MKIALSSTGYLGLWYDGPGLTPLEFLRRARQLDFDGVVLDGRRPHGSPLDLDAGRRRAIRDLSADLALDVVALAATTDFSTPVIEARAAQLLMLREQVRLAREIGAPVVRVFLAWPGVTVQDGLGTHELARRRFDQRFHDVPWLETWNTTKRCLREAARYAEDEDVILAIQNQAPPVRDFGEVLDLIAEVDSPRLRVCLDLSPLERQDAAGLRQVVRACGPSLVHARVDGEFARREGGVEPAGARHGPVAINCPAFVWALKDAGYDGYLGFEWARPALNALHDVEDIAFVDEQAALALEYLRGAIAAVERQEALPNGPDQQPGTVAVN
jgi:sugar phosphate isomerase/epimerase